MSEESDATACEVDLNCISELIPALGPDRVRELAAILRQRLVMMAEAGAAPPKGIDGLLLRIHKCRGSAGSLGFTTLARELAGIEALLVEPGPNGLDSVPEALEALVVTLDASTAILERRLASQGEAHSAGVRKL